MKVLCVQAVAPLPVHRVEDAGRGRMHCRKKGRLSGRSRVPRREARPLRDDGNLPIFFCTRKRRQTPTCIKAMTSLRLASSKIEKQNHIMITFWDSREGQVFHRKIF
jgi:hypothetical protein